MGRRFVGVEPYVVSRCPCCEAPDADTRYARICPRTSAKVKQNQPLVHDMTAAYERLGCGTRSTFYG